MAIEKTPKVTSIFLADAFREGSNKKLDALGLFDKFLVWGVTATRECSVIARIENVPAGVSKFNVLLQNENKVTQEIGEFTCDAREPLLSVITGLRMPITFKKIGKYKIGVKFEKATKPIYWFAFSVDLMPWLELPTGEQLAAMLADSQTLKHMRASIKCSKCEKTLVFQLSLDPDAKLERNVRPFPPSGKLKCPTCSLTHHLKDIEGQLRFHLVNQVKGAQE